MTRRTCRKGQPDAKPDGGLHHVTRRLRGRGRLAWVLGLGGAAVEAVRALKRDSSRPLRTLGSLSVPGIARRRPHGSLPRG